MTDQISTLGLAIDSADVRRAARDLDGFSLAGKRSEQSAAGISSAMGVLRGAVSGYLALDVARQVLRQADAYASLTARLALVTSGTANLATVQAQLFDVSQRTRVDAEKTVDLYATLARATKPLGVSQKDLIAVTESINKALIVSGTNAQSASAALMQLGQGFGSGVLRGEELNSVMEQTPRLAEAIAEGLGVPQGALRKLGEAGELTAEKVFNALKKAGDSIDREFSRMPATVGGALTQVRNSTFLVVGAFDKASGATSALAGVLSGAASGIKELAGELSRADEIARDFSTTAGVVLTAVETLKLLGSDVRFVFNGIGTEIGGIAAQLAALGRGDFKGFALIGEQMKADAAAARKALDDYQKGVVSRPAVGAIDTSVNDAESAKFGRYQAAAVQLDKYRQARADFLKEFASDNEKFEAELKKRKAALGPLFMPADAQRLRDKMFPKLGANALGIDIDKIKQQLDTALSAYQNSEQLLEASRSAGLISLGDYYAARADLVRKDLDSQVTAFLRENELLESRNKKVGANSPEGKANTKQIEENAERVRRATDKAQASLDVLEIQGGGALRNVARGYAEARQAAEQFYAEQERAQRREIAMLTMSDRDRQRTQGLAQIEDRYDAERRRLINERALLEQQQKPTGGLRTDQREQYEKLLALQDEYQRRAIESYERSVDARLEAEGRWQIGATRAVQNYANEAANTMKQAEAAYGNVFRSLEDTLTEFVKTGKVSFKSLADTIISEFARIQARRIVAQYSDGLGSALGSLFGSSFGGGGGAASSGSADWFASLSGGRAIGGPVSAGQTYQVNERGVPEIARVGGQDYLTMGNQGGKVTPLDGSIGGVTNHFHIGAGVQRGEIVALIPELERRITASVEAKARRPGGRG